MKKNNFKKMLVVFSLCVFLLSLFSISSFALNIDDVRSGYLYQITGSLTPSDSLSASGSVTVSGYVVDKTSGEMTSFSSLYYNKMSETASPSSPTYWALDSRSSSSNPPNLFNPVSGVHGKIYIEFSNNSMSRADFESFLNERWTYTVTSFSVVETMFDKANIALVGGTNSEGVAYDGLLGIISKFGKSLVSSPLLLVLCIALPLVSFSVGLIIRIKNRA